jgi:DNA polymerase V
MTTPGNNKHGGRRKGAGRKPGYGRYGEATKLLRIPNSQLKSVTDFLLDYQKRIELSKEATKRLIGQMMLPLDEPPEQRIPLYGTKIRAGFPSPADDYIEAELDLNQLLIKNPPATFMLRVEGDSMTGAGIFQGDTIVVDRSLNPKHGNVVVAAIDGQLTVKRLYKRNGRTRLDAENSSFAPIELQDGQELIIFGVVTSCIHPVK